MTIVAKPLTPEEFAPYGDVLTSPPDFGRIYYDQGLATLRSAARPSLSVSHAKFLSTLPLEATVMERHEFSSQSFVPIDVSRWLVIVAPPGGTWHHPLTLLDRPGRFAVFMWRDGTKTDEEFRTLATPFTVTVRD